MTTRSLPKKKRHLFLSAYLIFLAVTNGLSAIFMLMGLSKANNPHGDPIGWKLIFIGIFTLAMMASLGLWRWRRWGYWLYLFCTLVWLALEITAGARAVSLLSTVAVFAVLHAAVHLGGEKSAWRQLE